MTDTLFLADFRRAAASEGCPFCALITETTQRYLRFLLKESVLAPQIHQQLAASRGFCRAHAWLLESEGDGVAILYGTVLQTLRHELSEGLAQAASPAKRRWRGKPLAPLGTSLRDQLSPKGSCLVCEHQAQSTAFALGQLVEELNEGESEGALAPLYQATPGACLPHFLHLLELAVNDSTARWLAETQLQHITVLEAQLDESRRGNGKTGTIHRAIAQTAGLR